MGELEQIGDLGHILDQIQSALEQEDYESCAEMRRVFDKAFDTLSEIEKVDVVEDIFITMTEKGYEHKGDLNNFFLEIFQTYIFT